MMEVYQAYGDCRTMMELIESLVTTVAMKTVGTLKIDHGNGKVIDLTLPVAPRDLQRTLRREGRGRLVQDHAGGARRARPGDGARHSGRDVRSRRDQ